MAVISEWVAWNGKYPPAGSIGERNTLSFLQKDRVLNMKYRTRTYYSAEQKAEMWDRWQRGESMNSIARLFDRGHSSVQGILSTTGGIRPRERRRSRHVLTLAEREEISRIQGVRLLEHFTRKRTFRLGQYKQSLDDCWQTPEPETALVILAITTSASCGKQTTAAGRYSPLPREE